MKFEIKNRFTGSIIFSIECDSFKLCAEAAINQKADLYGADLRGANLRGADLREADLYGANLGGADLREADLYGANLGGADLRGDNLYGANLGEADLRGANLYGADLREADLYGANLGGADLREADLYGANLGEKIGKLKANGFFSAGPLGSRNDALIAFHSDKGIFVKAGCFSGSLDEFRTKVIETHGETSKHGKLYLGMANIIEYKFSVEDK